MGIASMSAAEDERRYAKDVADWCERELVSARRTGHLETRPFVQNAVLIIAALREYAVNEKSPPT